MKWSLPFMLAAYSSLGQPRLVALGAHQIGQAGRYKGASGTVKQDKIEPHAGHTRLAAGNSGADARCQGGRRCAGFQAGGEGGRG
jgi:hypothetical protein